MRLFCKQNAQKIGILSGVAFAQDAASEDEVEGEGVPPPGANSKDATSDDDYDKKVGPSPDAQVSFYFTEPQGGGGMQFVL